MTADLHNLDGSVPGTDLIYSTLEYWQFLNSILGSDLEILTATNKSGKTICLPLLSVEGPFGRVANSLPFYGGHGLPAVNVDDQALRSQLLAQVEDRISLGAYQSVTVIENPFSPLAEREVESLAYLEEVESRISQMTIWSSTASFKSDDLLLSFHQKTRNAVRKGLSNLQEVFLSDDPSVIEFLVREHQESISRLGGLSKTQNQIEALHRMLDQNTRIYVATTKKGSVGAALLTLENRNITEYFIPVVRHELRESQLLSALIFKVMCMSFEEGRTIWNWGGTWKNQSGVYRFKSRFGSSDRNYRYFGWSTEKLSSQSSHDLVANYPYWYVRKF